MQNLEKNILFAILFLGASVSIHSLRAQAETTLGVSAVASSGVPDDSLVPTDRNIQIGLGFSHESSLYSQFGLETGIFYVNRVYKLGEGDRDLLTEQGRRIQLSVLGRWEPVSFISLGVGPFVSFRSEEAKRRITEEGFDPQGLKTSADDFLETGLELASTAEVSVTRISNLFLEARFNYVFDRGENEDSTQFMGLFGFNIALGDLSSKMN